MINLVPSRRRFCHFSSRLLVASSLFASIQADAADETVERLKGESAKDFVARIIALKKLEAAVEQAFKAIAAGYPNQVHAVRFSETQVMIRMGNPAEWLPLEDGVTGKSFDDRIAAPDLAETLSIPYPRDLNMKSWPENVDPGRIRNDAFLKAIYGQSAADVKKNLVNVKFGGVNLPFNQSNGAAEALSRVSVKVDSAVAKDPALRLYLTKLGGTFNWRKIAGTNRLSAHSYGISIDLNPALGGYWKWGEAEVMGDMARRHKYPVAIVEAFESEGFIWGGKWYHFDLMHFEYRPEFFGRSKK